MSPEMGKRCAGTLSVDNYFFFHKMIRNSLLRLSHGLPGGKPVNGFLRPFVSRDNLNWDRPLSEARLAKLEPVPKWIARFLEKSRAICSPRSGEAEN
jgi:hypothetical protein